MDPIAWFLALPITTQILLGYGVAINLVTFLFFGFDKMRATSGGSLRRVPEKTLWILSLVGGSLGALLAMNLFRHKTKKLSFQAVLALILALQVILVFYLLNQTTPATPSF